MSSHRSSLWVCISAVASGLQNGRTLDEHSVNGLVAEIIEMGENQRAELRKDFRTVVEAINQIEERLNGECD
jgi:hypothetical protein